MFVDLEKSDLINLLTSIMPHDLQDCDNLRDIGAMKFVGNQHNPEWSWNRKYLEDVGEYTLFDLYTKLKQTNIRKCCDYMNGKEELTDQV